MSEKEQQQYKIETGKRPLYFNKPSNDFKKWLELKIDSTNIIQEVNIEMDKKMTNTQQINLKGELMENRIRNNIRRRYKKSQKNGENTQKQSKITSF